MITSRQWNVARALAAVAATFALAPTAFAAELAVKAPPPEPAAVAWEGLYAGVSFGPALIRAATSTASRNTTTSTTTNLAGPVVTQTSITDVVSNGSGRNWGALSDVYLGYNFRLGGNVIAGVQVEGTIANAQAQLDVAQGQVSSTTTVTTPPGSISSLSSLSSSSFIDSLAERWAVSVLGRLGVLVDPRDLIYVIGGYTYGGFDWGGRTFGLHGATVGAGWEHEVAPGWTLKAEYRYTRFQDKDLPQSASSTATQTTVSPLFGNDVFVSTSGFTATDRVSGLDLHALRFGITHYFNSGAPIVSANAMVTKGPPLLAMPWEGLYGGVSDGLASIRATTATVSRNVTNTTQRNPSGSIAATTSTTDTLSNGSGSNWGSLSDVYLGYNFRLGSNVIAGLQVEGTIAEAQAQLSTTQLQTSNSTRVTTPPGTTTITSSLSAFSSIDSIAERWAVSALGRVGWLVDPRDLIYLIGGYTYGGFEWSSRTFGLNGATVGAGWEYEVAPGWTFKAEYRYTQFQDKDLPRSTGSASTTTSVGTTGLLTTTASNGTFTTTDRVSGIALHALRFGITHYFNGGAPVVSANAMATKAPPPAAAPWTGLYGGVSAGLTSMHTRTATTSNELFTETFTVPGASLVDVEPVNTVSNTRGRHGGAVADIFVGYNVALGANVIAGAQLERSIAHASTRGDGIFGQALTLTDVQTPPGGAAGTSVITGTSTGTTTFDVQSRWMASALARLGWLADPRDLVYAIGGWSYGGFTSFERVFNLNGPTVGAGVEREFAPSWTVRAEYRYTHFFARDVPFPATSIANQTTGTAAVAFTDVFNETDRIGVNLHAFRIGIAHYFASR